MHPHQQQGRRGFLSRREPVTPEDSYERRIKSRRNRTKTDTLPRSLARAAVIGGGALAGLLVLTALAYQAIASARDARRFPPPGKRVDVGRCRLHLHSTGEGGPKAVLDASWLDCSLNWFRVRPEVAKLTRVCAVANDPVLRQAR